MPRHPRHTPLYAQGREPRTFSLLGSIGRAFLWPLRAAAALVVVALLYAAYYFVFFLIGQVTVSCGDPESGDLVSTSARCQDEDIEEDPADAYLDEQIREMEQQEQNQRETDLRDEGYIDSGP